MKREFIVLYSLLLVLTLAVGALGGYVYFSSRSGRGSDLAHGAQPAGEAGPELPPQGLRLAQGWKCMCGACADDLLVCHCNDKNGAHEIKNLIRERLAGGVGEAEIREELIKLYGARVVGDAPAAAPPPATTAAPPKGTS